MHIPEPYSEFIPFFIVLSFFSFFILWMAKSKGFFILPQNKPLIPISLKAVLVLFGAYLISTLLFAPILLHIVHLLYTKYLPGKSPSFGALGGVQLIVLLLIFLLFFLYTLADSPMVFKRIWKNRNIPNAKSIIRDLEMGFLTWFIAFPLVLLIGEVCDIILYAIFGVENYEQVAVRYLKQNLLSFETIIIPLFIILFAAPIIEEFLFRGCLQNFLKKHLSVQKAIGLSSLFFAFFHFAPSQGIGNISLLISLFTFALFLGFIYERQASLFASIGLHITFNTFSTIRILFFS